MRDRFGHRPAGLAGRDLASPRTHSSSPCALRMQMQMRRTLCERTIQFSRTEGALGSRVGGGTVITVRLSVKRGLKYFVERFGPRGVRLRKRGFPVHKVI